MSGFEWLYVVVCCVLCAVCCVLYAVCCVDNVYFLYVRANMTYFLHVRANMSYFLYVRSNISCYWHVRANIPSLLRFFREIVNFTKMTFSGHQSAEMT